MRRGRVSRHTASSPSPAAEATKRFLCSCESRNPADIGTGLLLSQESSGALNLVENNLLLAEAHWPAGPDRPSLRRGGKDHGQGRFARLRRESASRPHLHLLGRAAA